MLNRQWDSFPQYFTVNDKKRGNIKVRKAGPTLLQEAIADTDSALCPTQEASMTSDMAGNLPDGSRCFVTEIDEIELPGGKGKKVHVYLYVSVCSVPAVGRLPRRT